MQGKKKLIVVMLVITTLAFASGIAAFPHRWDFDDAEEVKNLAGTIEYSQMWGFTLSTSSGDQYRLLLHPMRFLEETEMELGANDRVSISGYRVEDDVIWVSTVTKGSKTYEIADPNQIRQFGPDSGYGPYANNRPGSKRGDGRKQSGSGWGWNEGNGHCW
jgi:hypothetical protein